MTYPIRLVYFVSHPIQYQAPLLRQIAEEPDIDLHVIFTRGAATKRLDPGFGKMISYDVPLLDGYSWDEFSWARTLVAIRRSSVVWFHGWAGLRQLFALLASQLLRKTVLMRCETWQGGHQPSGRARSWIRRMLHTFVLRRSSAGLAIGTQNRRYLELLGLDPKRIFHMPYAVDNNRFSTATARDTARIRSALGVQGEEKIVLYAGKLSDRKLPDVLVRAWQTMDKNGCRVHLVFAGEGEKLPTLRSMEDDPCVHFLGFVNQSELPAVYGAADLFVLASRAEPWGLAVNEAMAAGTAVVVSDEVGAAEDLVDESTGRVVPAGNPAALADAMSSALAVSDRLGRNAQQKICRWGLDDSVAGLRSALTAVGALSQDRPK